MRSSSSHGHLHDPLVGQPEVVQDDHGPVGRGLDRELHVGEHPAAPALGHEQRAALAGGVDGEPVAVDQAHAGRHRVDPQAVEGQVEEGHDGWTRTTTSPEATRGSSASSSTGALGHERRPGDGVDDGAAGVSAASTRSSTMAR